MLGSLTHHKDAAYERIKMPEEQKTINWPSVLTTAVSTLVATIVVGAAVMVWNKTVNIDNDIANAKSTGHLLRMRRRSLCRYAALPHVHDRRWRSKCSALPNR